MFVFVLCPVCVFRAHDPARITKTLKKRQSCSTISNDDVDDDAVVDDDDDDDDDVVVVVVDDDDVVRSAEHCARGQVRPAAPRPPCRLPRDDQPVGTPFSPQALIFFDSFLLRFFVPAWWLNIWFCSCLLEE